MVPGGTVFMKLNQIALTDSTLKSAVSWWVPNKSMILDYYGPMSDWDVSKVKNMAFLFMAF